MSIMRFKRLIAALLCGAIFTAAAYPKLLLPSSAASQITALFYGTAAGADDMVHQSTRARSGQVVIVGIDASSLERLGPLPWSRSVYADAIEHLNSAEAGKPAVIGIDVLFIGENVPGDDARLVEAARQGGNVVLASQVNFETGMIMNNGVPMMSQDRIGSYEAPFEELAKVTGQGHINAMQDVDGIIRRAMLNITLPDHRVIPAFHLQLAEAYANRNGKELTMPPENGQFWYLPFTGRPEAYWDGYSIADLLEGSLDPNLFTDKIVLIGPYATGLQDHYFTAIDHAKAMYGVEIQANAVEALLTGEFRKELPDLLCALLLFVITAGCVWLFIKRKLWQATAVWLLAGGGWLALCFLLRERYLLPVLFVPAGVTVSYILCLGINYVRSALEKSRIMHTFERYVAPEIVKEITKEGTDALKLGGKLTDIAVLFVDIRGFTPMSELLSPTEVVEILNQYLTLTSSCIMENRGTLDKFIGDATMAFWGAPLPQEDYIYQAVKAAWEMKEASETLNAQLQKQHGRTVGFGIGVHAGSAVVGNIGANKRMDYTAIGDTVNTAARLEANAPSGTIYISRAVADALKGRIKVTSLSDTIRLKGKAEGFEVLILEGLIDTGM